MLKTAVASSSRISSTHHVVCWDSLPRRLWSVSHVIYWFKCQVICYIVSQTWILSTTAPHVHVYQSAWRVKFVSEPSSSSGSAADLEVLFTRWGVYSTANHLLLHRWQALLQLWAHHQEHPLSLLGQLILSFKAWFLFQGCHTFLNNKFFSRMFPVQFPQIQGPNA